MSGQHTQGQLEIRRTASGEIKEIGPFVPAAEFCGDTWLDVSEEDARRLVTCWNACEGVQTNEIEELAAIGGVPSLITYSKDLRAERDLAWQQRDQLLEMLEGLLDIDGPQPGTKDWADRSRAVIEQVTGAQLHGPGLQLREHQRSQRAHARSSRGAGRIAGQHLR